MKQTITTESNGGKSNPLFGDLELWTYFSCDHDMGIWMKTAIDHYKLVEYGEL